MNDTTYSKPLHFASFWGYAEAHDLALFPVVADTKIPISGFAWTRDSSRDPAVWAQWVAENPGCNFGIAAEPSRLAIVDVDASRVGREAAWTAWHQMCRSWGLPGALAPFCQSARGGWHVAIARQADAAELRGTAVLARDDDGRELIGVKVRGYTVAPGSYYDGTARGEQSGWYALMPDAPAPHPCPGGLLTALARPVVMTPAGTGESDPVDLAGLVDFLAGQDEFAGYEEWLQCGMALKLAAGDDGLAAWRCAHDGTVTPEVEASKWQSFAGEPRPGAVTIAWLIRRARELGWQGSIRRTVEAMFGDVVQRIATAAGATLTHSKLRPRRINAAALDGKPVPKREWLIPDLIPAGNVTLLYGDGGTGKSLLALMAGVSVVALGHFFGRPVRQGGVEFITAEDSIDEMHRRLTDIAHHHQIPLSALTGLHVTSLADEDAILAAPEDGRGGALAATPLYTELDTLLAESCPALLVLDTLADVYGGNEIVRAQVRQFVGMLRRLALRYGCTILVLAHPSLSGMDKGTSGSTGWSNSVRSRLYFQRMHDGDGREPDEDARVLRVGKSNYGRVGLEIPMRWQAGVFVPVATTPAGDSLVQRAKAERLFLELLEKYTVQDRPVSVATGPNYAPKIFEVAGRPLGVGKRALTEAMNRLLEDGRIENVPYGPPSRHARRLMVSTPNSSGSV